MRQKFGSEQKEIIETNLCILNIAGFNEHENTGQLDRVGSRSPHRKLTVVIYDGRADGRLNTRV